VTALAIAMDEADDGGDFRVRYGLLQGDVEPRQHVSLQSGRCGFLTVVSRFELTSWCHRGRRCRWCI
jgi:hypothetical protein